MDEMGDGTFVPRRGALNGLFNYNQDKVSLETGLNCEDVSLAKQEMRDECDINTIAYRFGISGQVPVGVRMPTFEDFSEVTDFQTAMNSIALARESFDAMQANVRARFNNDPQAFVEFCSREENRAEAEKLGLVPAKPAAAPVVVADQPVT